MSLHSRPLGEATALEPAKRPARVTISGAYITLTPLLPDHSTQLFALVGGDEAAWLWDYMHDGPFPDLDDFSAFISGKAVSDDPFYFAIMENSTQSIIGFMTLMRIDPANRVVEVGNIMFSPRLQQTRGATESQFLLARYVFESLGYRRYEWKCNALNTPSRRAAERLGFKYEGTFRKHMITKGRNRDTAWFSMLDDEWPATKAGFEAWLSDDNFNGNGKQICSLAELRQCCSTGAI